MMDKKLKCVAVRSPRGAKTTEIDWGDGHKGIYPHAVLRGYCPCAGCQGHDAAIRFIEVPDGAMLEIENIEDVGNYALRFDWFDGHGTGIYTFRYLRALCECSECKKEGDHPPMPRL
jgi:DUF971 family protein